MKQEKLSPAQWGALFWTAALAPASELLPGAGLELAGRGAWLTALSALLFLLPLLWIARDGDGTDLRRSMGGKVVLGLCVLWMVLLTALRLALCARRMLWSGERDGAVWYFLLTLAAITLWVNQGRLAPFGRTGQLFLVVLLGAAVLVLGLSLPKLRADRVLPLWSGDVVPVVLGGISTAGSLCWAVLPMLLLPTQRRKGKDILLWGAGGGVLLTLAQLIIIGNLGVGLTAQSDSAFFALTKSVGIEGAFQRVESVVAALWMLSDLILCAAMTHAVGLACEEAVFHVRRETVSSFALLAAAGIALWMVRWGASIEEWNREWVWMGNLIACLGASGGIAIVKKTKTG